MVQLIPKKKRDMMRMNYYYLGMSKSIPGIQIKVQSTKEEKESAEGVSHNICEFQ